MAYYPTQAVQPITAGTSKPAVPTSGLGCPACGIVAVSGLGAGDVAANMGKLLVYGAIGAASAAGLMWLIAKATESGSDPARARAYAKYGSYFGAAVGGFYYTGAAQAAQTVQP